MSRPADEYLPSSAAAADFHDAIATAYAGVEKIQFDGMQYRRDIGRKALRTSRMKYSIVTFGCRVNQADSLGFEEELLSRGGVAVAPDDADLVVVNTCSVTATRGSGREADDSTHRARQSGRAHRRDGLLRDASSGRSRGAAERGQSHPQ